MGDHKGFTVVLRGYDIGEVEALLSLVRQALPSADPATRAAARAALDGRAFNVRMRGYDRAEVDAYLRRAVDRLA